MTVSVKKVEALENALEQVEKVQSWLTTHNFMDTPDSEEYDIPEEYKRLKDGVGFTRQVKVSPELSDYKFFIQNWGIISEYLKERVKKIEENTEKLKQAIDSLDEFMEPIRVAEEL